MSQDSHALHLTPRARALSERSERTEGIRNRDPAILDAVVRECLPGLLRAARAAGLEPDQADDAVQAAFLVFFRRAHEFDGRARCSTWLYGILVRTIAERRRSSWRDQDSEDIDRVVESRFDAQGRWTSPPHGPDHELALAQIREQLADCLGAIPDRQRLAFQLREVEGLSTDEVCNILEVTPNNLGVLLFRARNRLRECLERKGIEGSGDAVV